MGKAYYEILEFRAVVQDNWTELYAMVKITGDFPPEFGGWYKKVIPPEEPALHAFEQAFKNGEVLYWDRGAP